MGVGGTARQAAVHAVFINHKKRHEARTDTAYRRSRNGWHGQRHYKRASHRDRDRRQEMEIAAHKQCAGREDRRVCPRGATDTSRAEARGVERAQAKAFIQTFQADTCEDSGAVYSRALALLDTVCDRLYVAAFVVCERGIEYDHQHKKDLAARRRVFFYRQLASYKLSTRALYEAGWRCRKAMARKKGECGKYVGRGRFAEKGGGQQVGSAFSVSETAERIKALYGNNSFWSWLRYWYLDNADKTLLMLIDKGYYDYDYAEVEKKEQEEIHPPREKAATQDIFARFGWGKVKTLKDESGNGVTSSVESVQAAAMRKLQNDKKTSNGKQSKIRHKL